MASKIFIVEDDKDIAALVTEILTDHGHTVERTVSADKALEHIHQSKPQLIILDVELPGMSGFDLCQILRKDASMTAVPILMLTMHKGTSHKVHGLEIGADDYLTKPFHPEELAARVNALLRRTRPESPSKHILKTSGVTVDLDKHTILVRGQTIDLPQKEFRLLCLFLEKEGQVLTKEFLLESLWPSEAVGSSETLRQHVKNLRKALGPEGERIEVLVNIGYKFSDA